MRLIKNKWIQCDKIYFYEQKVVKCSYLAAFHIAKWKKAYIVGEMLLKFCMKDICSELFGKEYEAKINCVSMSNYGISQLIIDLSDDIKLFNWRRKYKNPGIVQFN